MELEDIKKRWQRTARGRLKFELGGLSFAIKAGFSPEDYARHLWADGAAKWMGKANPTAEEYLLKEAEAFRTLYPQVEFELGKCDDDKAELTFVRGCLGGWGKDRWSMVKSSGLGKKDMCRYCRQAFRTWAEQLGLDACTVPQANGTCVLRVKRSKQAGDG